MCASELNDHTESCCWHLSGLNESPVLINLMAHCLSNKNAMDTVASRVQGLEWREGATHSVPSPLPPQLEEQGISLRPSWDDLLLLEGSRDWCSQQGDRPRFSFFR